MWDLIAVAAFAMSIVATVIAVFDQPWLLVLFAPLAYFMFRPPKD